MRPSPALALLGALGALAAELPARAEQPAGDTLSVQAKGAGLGLVLGGGIGLLAGFGLGGRDKLPAALAGAAVGITFGIPIGVQRTADGQGGTGRGWGTTLGAIIGSGAAGAAIFGAQQGKSKLTPETAISTFLIVLACVSAGPIIGYRTTQSHETTATPVMLSFTF